MRREKRPKRTQLIVIVGATSTGKSKLALKLAQKHQGEIISFDAMQMYRGVPVLTNQPSKEDQKTIRHHFIGFLPLDKTFSADQFSKKAEKVILNVFRRKKVPILVGGSGFYLKTLLEGSHASAQGSEAVRKKYSLLCQKKGSAFLHKRLMRIDPQRAKAIHPNDAYRITRALEIFEMTGKKPSAFKRKAFRDRWENVRIQKIGLRLTRPKLYQKINQDVQERASHGALREVKRALRKTLSPTARKMIGFPELSAYLKGKCSLEEAMAEMQKHTRQYAKRQETWFRKEKGIRWRSVRLSSSTSAHS